MKEFFNTRADLASKICVPISQYPIGVSLQEYNLNAIYYTLFG